jgi:hypothetical protein
VCTDVCSNTELPAIYQALEHGEGSTTVAAVVAQAQAPVTAVVREDNGSGILVKLSTWLLGRLVLDRQGSR